MKVLVAYDGTLQAKDALRYGATKVKENGGELIALHVFNTNMFIGYDSHPRAKELARAEAAGYLEDARSLIRETKVSGRVAVEEGDPEEEILQFAVEKKIDVLLCPPRYKGIINKYKKLLSSQGKNVEENAIFDETNKVKMVVSLQ